MVKVWRTIRIDDDIVLSCEIFMASKMGITLGLKSVKETVEYFTRQGLEKHTK